MATTAQIPTPKSGNLVSYTVKVNGVAVPVDLNGLVVEKEVNRIPGATLVMGDGSPTQQHFALSSATWFVPGNNLEVYLGYHSDETLIFKGIVVKHRIEVHAGVSQLEAAL